MEILLSQYDNKYSVSLEGEIYSLKGTKKRLQGKIGKTGYRQILINHNSKRLYLLVHRIVASIFVPNPEGKRTVNHIDGNKLNNHASNLEWNTDSENLIHARDNNLLTQCKINIEIAEKIRSDTGSNRELAKKYGIGKTQIGYIKQNIRWVKE